MPVVVVEQAQTKMQTKVLVVVVLAALELEQAKALRLERNTQLRLALPVLVEHLPLIRGQVAVIHLSLGVLRLHRLHLRVLFLLAVVAVARTEIME